MCLSNSHSDAFMGPVCQRSCMLSPCFESIVMYRMCGVSNTQESHDDSIDVSLECATFERLTHTGFATGMGKDVTKLVNGLAQSGLDKSRKCCTFQCTSG